jgi:hypothetical protein
VIDGDGHPLCGWDLQLLLKFESAANDSPETAWPGSQSHWRVTQTVRLLRLRTHPQALTTAPFVDSTGTQTGSSCSCSGFKAGASFDLWDDATGTFRGESLTIQYEVNMQHADFEDAVYACLSRMASMSVS